jgi:NAD(P)-dependent dehydrogenase (short-subunit alcohol dehydrogenase family)
MDSKLSRGLVKMDSRRSVLITGCSSGLGKATAVYLRSQGWRVFAAVRKTTDQVALEQQGFESVCVDLSDSHSIKTGIAKILELSGGKLDALVNNAGYTQFGAVEDLTRDEIRQQFETNVFGTIEITNLLIPIFRNQRFGRIVFMSSICGRISLPYYGSYCASKFALEAFADALRLETRGSGIQLQLLEPGLFKTQGQVNSRRLFDQQAGARPSIHKNRYQQTLAFTAARLEQLPENRSQQIALAVEDFLENRNCHARRMLPTASLVYELTRRLLPDRLQDFLIAWRGRKTRPQPKNRQTLQDETP